MYFAVVSRQSHVVPQEDGNMFDYIVHAVAVYDFTI